MYKGFPNHSSRLALSKILVDLSYQLWTMYVVIPSALDHKVCKIYFFLKIVEKNLSLASTLDHEIAQLEVWDANL
jgi:hypothetical protein